MKKISELLSSLGTQPSFPENEAAKIRLEDGSEARLPLHFYKGREVSVARLLLLGGLTQRSSALYSAYEQAVLTFPRQEVVLKLPAAIRTDSDSSLEKKTKVLPLRQPVKLTSGEYSLVLCVEENTKGENV